MLSTGCLLYSTDERFSLTLAGEKSLYMSQKKRSGTYCSSFGIVHIAVWDDFRQCDNPVVDFVSSSPFHYRMKNI